MTDRHRGLPRRLAPHGRGDDGSMLLFFLVLIVVGGLTAVTLSVTAGNFTSTKHEKNFTVALPGADKNVQRAVVLVNSGAAASLPAAPASGVSTGSNGCPTSTGWYAKHVSPLKYEVYSTQTVNGVSRCLTADIEQSPRFVVAAFAQTDITFRGGNNADSYKHSTGATNTGHGYIGTNGSVTFNGNTSDDGTHLYSWEIESNPGRCNANGDSNGCDNVVTIDPPFDIQSDQSTAFMHDKVNSLCGTDPQPWDTNTNGTTFPAGEQCYSSVHIRQTTTVANPAASCGSTTQASIVYVTGTVTVDNGLDVNYVAPTTSDPCALQFYVLGTSVGIGNQGHFVAAVWAPFAECAGNNSNAQTDIYGSLICASIGNQGGWDFHYDDDLGSIGTSIWGITHYAEAAA